MAFIDLSSYDEHMVDDDRSCPRSIPGIICGYAYFFSDWSEILGYQIPDFVTAKHIEAQYAAPILYDLTFFGYEEEEMISKRNELDRSCEEVKRIHELPEEEQKEYYTTFEELCAEAGISLERTEEEKQNNERIYRKSCVLSQINVYRAIRAVYDELN